MLAEYETWIAYYTATNLNGITVLQEIKRSGAWCENAFRCMNVRLFMRIIQTHNKSSAKHDLYRLVGEFLSSEFLI